jgi:hypothetical protein
MKSLFFYWGLRVVLPVDPAPNDCLTTDDCITTELSS